MCISLAELDSSSYMSSSDLNNYPNLLDIGMSNELIIKITKCCHPQTVS